MKTADTKFHGKIFSSLPERKVSYGEPSCRIMPTDCGKNKAVPLSCMMECGGREAQTLSLLISDQGRVSCQLQAPTALLAVLSAGGWIGPRPGLNALEKKINQLTMPSFEQTR